MKINQLTLAIATGVIAIALCHEARAAGGVPLWTNFYNGPANDSDVARAVAVDSSGNVFVTGSSTFSSGSTLRTGCGTVKYSNDGVPLWTNRFDGPGNSGAEGRAVAVDS